MPRASYGRRRGLLARLARLGLALLLCAMFLPALIGWGRAAVECRMLGGGTPVERPTVEPPAVAEGGPAAGTYARPEEQTYLTLPEWYIVYSADEYAAFLNRSQPSGFPYFSAVGQFWRAYFDVCTVTQDRYPFNSGTHLMLAVIGTSFTAENVVKGVYENTIGRVSEWASTGQPTAEEQFAREVAAEYGTFLHTTPWYMFPFWERLQRLWQPSLSGPNMVRKVERRLALTIEYAVKAGYGWAIKQATESVYAPEDLTIWARADGNLDGLTEREPTVRLVQSADGRPPLLGLPRYEAFTRIMPRLVEQGVRFSEIAGNDEIMLTVLAPASWNDPGPDAERLFSMPILTEPGRTRYALKVPVGALHTVVERLAGLPASDGVTIEHIYDY